MPTLDELIKMRESPEYQEQLQKAFQAAMVRWEQDAKFPCDPIYNELELDLPECPWHGEYLDDDGGCCLCYEQTGDEFAYREVSDV